MKSWKWSIAALLTVLAVPTVGVLGIVVGISLLTHQADPPPLPSTGEMAADLVGWTVGRDPPRWRFAPDEQLTVHVLDWSVPHRIYGADLLVTFAASGRGESACGRLRLTYLLIGETWVLDRAETLSLDIQRKEVQP